MPSLPAFRLANTLRWKRSKRGPGQTMLLREIENRKLESVKLQLNICDLIVKLQYSNNFKCQMMYMIFKKKRKLDTVQTITKPNFSLNFFL